jgi:hypothetical protein
MKTKCSENQVIGTSDTESFRVEVISLGSNSLQISFYEHGDVKRYSSWKMPLPVAAGIVAWWQEQDAAKNQGIWKRSISISIPASSSRHIDVRELDALGRTKPGGWSLPMVVVEAMTKELPNLKDNTMLSSE